MFKNLKEFFLEGVSLEVDRNGEPSSEEMKIAAVVLLDAMAYVDGALHPQELAEVVDSVMCAFKAGESEVGELLEIVEAIHSSSQSDDTKQAQLESFVKVINQAFDAKQRILVLAMLLNIGLGDGLDDQRERDFVEGIRVKLNLTKAEAHQAQLLAESGDA